MNVVLGARTTICSLYFTENCFHYGIHGRRLLREGSFPSLHLPTSAVAVVSDGRTEPLTNKPECSTKNIAIKRPGEVIEDGIPNKEICLENELLQKSATVESTESNLSLQYLRDRIIFKNEEISSLKRKNSRLHSHLKQVQTKNKLMHTKMGSIPKALLSLFQLRKKKVASYPLPLRIFASTVSFMSPKAYKYV